MSVSIKSEREIALMREAGRILEKVLDHLGENLKAGMTTKDIDDLGYEMIRSYDCIPSFLDYRGYPASICVSVNDEVVHGIPSPKRKIREGDIVSLDAGVIYKGYHSDAARTFGIGEISNEAKNLIKVTRESFFEGIKFAKSHNHLGDISNAIGRYCNIRGYGVVRDLCGHGIGTSLHEDPEIPNYEVDKRGLTLRSGMTLAIEPMINIGTWEVYWMDDDWTVVTADGKLSAHYENTVLITDGEPEILSLTKPIKEELERAVWN
ncbi:MAG: type I methionyl aminopeptidase [Lachnospiraceae bacterium]|jgi:methionyl aminopeptidase|nr:type I methionyl aminopeptidase [Lachnospiraceae bacterium]